MSMDLKTAQATISAAITANPEAIIAKAILWNPATAQIVEAVRAVPGPLAGVAANALKEALRGKDHAETTANIIRFAEQVQAE